MAFNLPARFLRAFLVCAAAASATVVLSATALPPARPALQLPECLPNVVDNPGIIQSRLAAVQADPAAVLPAIELARCFDLTWQFEHVERAITQALEAFEAETASAFEAGRTRHVAPGRRGRADTAAATCGSAALSRCRP